MAESRRSLARRWSVALLAACSLCACGGDEVPCERPDSPLVIEQLQLPGPAIGVSTVVHLPDGARMLLEVGNNSHDAIVRDAADGHADFVLVTHDDQDHAGGLGDLSDVLGDAVDLSPLGIYDLGGGVTLDVFLSDGVLAERQGEPPYPLGAAHTELDLRDEVPGIDREDNPRSVAAALRFGSFSWVFAGDLTGGGKGTPDVESVVAAAGEDLLVAGELDLLSLSHHGISSSNNAAWLDWLLPPDDVERHALVATSPAYLAAPNRDVLDAIAPRLHGGSVWTGQPGSLTPSDHPALRLTGAEVFVGVQASGEWWVCGEP